ncbi:CheR family methyltransferase [Devosia sp.]|uniref:CheR family methyltransferase n=1 Tax=Devosia sp. TaxID=1871048 RepID=UPI003A90C217
MTSDSGEIKLTEQEFARVKARVYQQAGISLSDSKRTLVVSRLSKLVRERQLKDLTGYLDYLERSNDGAANQDFINALTTNLTRFWREDHHFDHMVEYVGQLMKQPQRSSAGKPRLRIWSAGCSTGQEPYTIALQLLSSFPDLKRWDFRILATDIDTNVVAKAQAGVYPDSELNGLSSERARMFESGGSGLVRIPQAARQVISFKSLNLMNKPWPMKGPFDAIFCRNVAIYFDKPTQTELFRRLGELLAPGGFMYIGHSENVGGNNTNFRLVGKTIYQAKAPQQSRTAA